MKTISRDELIGDMRNASNARATVFVSEADLQHFLANYLHSVNKYDEVFLEYRIKRALLKNFPWKSKDDISIDIVLRSGNVYYPIELKYKTKSFPTILGIFGSVYPYELKAQNARNQNCYHFWKDIKRIELCRENFSTSVKNGVAVFVTNDEGYQNKPENDSNDYAQFALFQDRTVNNMCLDWAEDKNRNKFPPLQINGRYHICWDKLALLSGFQMLIC